MRSQIMEKQNKNIDSELNKTFKNKSKVEIVEDFNNNFYNQIPELREKHNIEHKAYLKSSYARKIIEENRTKRKILQKTMFIEYATDFDLHKIIMELKNTKATGLDNIQTEHIKQTKENTAKALRILVNKMIDKETWPELLKVQIIRPIFKKGDKLDLNNYRPVVLLSIINKILEKFFAIKIRSFLDINKILTESQFGYTKHKSTIDLLTEVNELI
jgi:hypothetical protein